MDAALSVLRERGVAGLTVDEVTTRAQVAKGTFYLYFRSKDHILPALRDRFSVDMAARVAADLGAHPGSPTARLERWVRTSVHEYITHADLHDALFHSPDTDSSSTADADLNPHAAQLTEILTAGVEANDFTCDPPRATVVLYYAVHGTADHVVGHTRGGGPPDAVENMIDELVRLVTAAVVH